MTDAETPEAWEERFGVVNTTSIADKSVKHDRVDQRTPRYRIETRGITTRVFDLKTGEALSDVVRVEFVHDSECQSTPLALITIQEVHPIIDVDCSDEDGRRDR